ncbi:hypothetical protein AB0H83_37990 [Dactylosporangium sp. NPDC050688]|uniref:hypothetical protein n=1 Tax=Dactylosporangium sp. NPDC050688 TaxID=3157217 RepID=UPI0033D36684
MKSSRSARVVAGWAAAIIVALVGALGVWWYWRSEHPPCIAGLRIDGFTETYRWYDRVEDVSRSYWYGPSHGDFLQAFHLRQVQLQQSNVPSRYGAYDEAARGRQPAGAAPYASVWVYRLRGLPDLGKGVLKREFEDRDLSDAQRAAVQDGTATILLVTVLCK